MKAVKTVLIGIVLLVLTQVSSCFASEVAPLLTQKQRFEIAQFKTFSGHTLQDVSVGWESYGQLNPQKDNVILITHYFTGSSHAAGKYSETDSSSGYWDAIIGPGKAIDTNRFFVISVDSLANISPWDPNVITTGPASVNPTTGQPYGLDFPVVTIRDFVNVQKAVLESLGIKKLYAVAGPSMGSMQAIDWALAYPDWVDRVISVIGTGQSDPWTTALLERWATPIKLDSHWNQGNYYGKQPPTDGLVAALMFITQDALHPEFFNSVGSSQLNFKPLESAPLQDIRASHSIITWLKERAKSRATHMDANHLLYLVRACQLFIAGHDGDLASAVKKIQAKTLIIPSMGDLLLMPYQGELLHQRLIEAGKPSEYAELQGPLGHLQGVSDIVQHAESIKHFLAE